MLRAFFFGLRFRAGQADDQRDRLFAGERALQLEAFVGPLKNAKGLQRFAGTQLRSIASSRTATQERWIRFMFFLLFKKLTRRASAEWADIRRVVHTLNGGSGHGKLDAAAAPTKKLF